MKKGTAYLLPTASDNDILIGVELALRRLGFRPLSKKEVIVGLEVIQVNILMAYRDLSTEGLLQIGSEAIKYCRIGEKDDMDDYSVPNLDEGVGVNDCLCYFRLH